LIDAGYKPLVECDTRMIDLIQRSFPTIKAREAIYRIEYPNDSPFNDYDLHLPMGSLMKYFRPDLDSFDNKAGAYLKVDLAKKSIWLERLEKIRNGKKVGSTIKRIRKEEKKLTPPYEIPIFKYGNPNTNDNEKYLGKPSITYLGNSQWKFNLTVPTNKDIENNTTYFVMTVPSQKWNNVVFNYYDNKVDLWINGNLERNMDLQENPLNHHQSDVITVGSKSGLIGGLCNLQFFSKPMTATQITQSYNLLYSQNPPLNNLH
jgi:hypothetical protein